jgi:hypothetical protein
MNSKAIGIRTKVNHMDALNDVRKVFERSFDEYWHRLHVHGNEELADLDRLSKRVQPDSKISRHLQAVRVAVVNRHFQLQEDARDMLRCVRDFIEATERSLTDHSEAHVTKRKSREGTARRSLARKRQLAHNDGNEAFS